MSNNDLSIEEQRSKKLEELFPTNEEKAKAFDKIAKHCYLGNFGTLSKSNLEVLLFSVYIDQILDNTEDDLTSYNRYNLSKWLGITQNKVDDLKVKKQLLYPREYSWEKAFLRVCKYAEYSNGTITINIPDKNLYHEIKNAIDEDGGYVETTLTPNLLKVSEKYFIPLLCRTTSGEDQTQLLTILKEESEDLRVFIEEKYDKKIKSEYTWKDVLVGITSDVAIGILRSFNPTVGDVADIALKNIKKKIESDKKAKAEKR